MKRTILIAAALALGLAAALPHVSSAQDVREAARKAAADRKAAEERAERIETQIMNDREALTAEVEKLEAQQKQLEAELASIRSRIERDEARRERLEDRWAKHELDVKEISGNVRVIARDLETTLTQSPSTAIHPERLERIQPLLDKGYFPDIDDISSMTGVFFDEMRRSGQVGLVDADYVGRDGETRHGRIMTIGNFTAVYKDGDETGFLTYQPDSKLLFALSTLPQRRVKRQLESYLAGKSESVPVDMSGGSALRQIVQKTSFRDQLRAGGPLVWPIGAIALAALFLIISQIVFLNQVHRNTGKYMTRVNELGAQGRWDECEEIVRRHKGKHSPVNHVIEAGLAARREDRETLESVLQEAILREMPRVERGLALLAVLGAIAPLLGLLGTVTGMIDTFRVITLFGTGDPKLMSGGISEALVTTELGLAIAIPIMLMHTFLSRRAEKIIGEMEEKAVSLSNIILKERNRDGILAKSA
jgi:biopolymer transport protein ExbB